MSSPGSSASGSSRGRALSSEYISACGNWWLWECMAGSYHVYTRSSNPARPGGVAGHWRCHNLKSGCTATVDRVTKVLSGEHFCHDGPDGARLALCDRKEVAVQPVRAHLLDFAFYYADHPCEFRAFCDVLQANYAVRLASVGIDAPGALFRMYRVSMAKKLALRKKKKVRTWLKPQVMVGRKRPSLQALLRAGLDGGPDTEPLMPYEGPLSGVAGSSRKRGRKRSGKSASVRDGRSAKRSRHHGEETPAAMRARLLAAHLVQVVEPLPVGVSPSTARTPSLRVHLKRLSAAEIAAYSGRGETEEVGVEAVEIAEHPEEGERRAVEELEVLHTPGYAASLASPLSDEDVVCMGPVGEVSETFMDQAVQTDPVDEISTIFMDQAVQTDPVPEVAGWRFQGARWLAVFRHLIDPVRLYSIHDVVRFLTECGVGVEGLLDRWEL